MNLSIHNVVKVLIKDTKFYETNTFYSRVILITDDKGATYEINLFSETNDQLEILK